MRFQSFEHQRFYERMKPKDCYQQALFYLIGLSPNTRNHAGELYSKDGINPEAIHAPWQTGTSVKLTRLAFNLYTDGVPTAHQFSESGQALPHSEETFKECQLYSVSDVFCCDYAPFFVEAIKLRYPEYCRSMETPEKPQKDRTAR